MRLSDLCEADDGDALANAAAGEADLQSRNAKGPSTSLVDSGRSRREAVIFHKSVLEPSLKWKSAAKHCKRIGATQEKLREREWLFTKAPQEQTSEAVEAILKC